MKPRRPTTGTAWKVGFKKQKNNDPRKPQTSTSGSVDLDTDTDPCGTVSLWFLSRYNI